MTDLGFRILLVASAVVLVLAVIDVVWLIRARHAADPGAKGDAKRIGRAREGQPHAQPGAKTTAARNKGVSQP